MSDIDLLWMNSKKKYTTEVIDALLALNIAVDTAYYANK